MLVFLREVTHASMFFFLACYRDFPTLTRTSKRTYYMSFFFHLSSLSLARVLVVMFRSPLSFFSLLPSVSPAVTHAHLTLIFFPRCHYCFFVVLYLSCSNKCFAVFFEGVISLSSSNTYKQTNVMDVLFFPPPAPCF